MRTFVLVLAVLFLAAVAPVAAGRSPRLSPSPIALTGAEEVTAPWLPADDHLPPHSLDDPIGDVYAAGTTWYDAQHNGTAGKMIAVDSEGYVHLVWMRGADAQNAQRHVFYNLWDPMIYGMDFGSGVQVDGTARAGYVTLSATPGGFAFPGFHWIVSSIYHTGAAIDFLPRQGAFTNFGIARLNNLDLIWPKIAMSGDSILHMVSTENSALFRIYYSRGVPIWDGEFGASIEWQPVGPGGAEFALVDTAAFVSPDIVASKISDRVAISYTKLRQSDAYPGMNNNVMCCVSEDGGLNWGPIVNLTQFAVQDTHRAWIDLSMVLDEQDYLHLAFTSVYLDEPNQIPNAQKSMLWHWDEQHNQFSALAEAWYNSPNGEPGSNMVDVNRPSLSIDPITDFVYCSYQKFDTAYNSQNGYFNADAWVTVSTDGGLHWSVGRNVTDTQPATNPAPAGQSQSERDITLADRITYSDGTGYLHLEWELDLDAGSAVLPLPEGMTTLNTVYYQRIPVEEIPLTPLMGWYPLHINEPPPEGIHRCCYGLPWQPSCAMLTETGCSLVNGTWDSTLTCATPCPATPWPGRCCHGDSLQPECEMRTFAECQEVNGSWDSTLTCDTPCAPPTGRCCYGPPAQPECAVVWEETCATLNGTWDATLLCSTPCPVTIICTCQDEPNTHCAMDTVAIPTSGPGVDVIINVPVEYHITDVNVCLDITHASVEEITLELISPAGTEVDLYSHQGSGANFRCTVFDSDAQQPIGQGTPPYNGHYRPLISLDTLDGENALGNWTLHIDATAQTGTLNWVCLNFSYDYIDAADDVPEVPTEYSLSAYPNPFNPSTSLRFGLEKAGRVTIDVFNIAGQRVQTLCDREYAAGYYSVVFDAEELPTGIYFAQIRAGEFVKTEKMVLLK